MAWEVTIYAFVGFASVLLFVGLLTVGIVQRWYRTAPAFFALMFAATLWTVFAAGSLGFTTLEGKLPWQGAAIAVSSLIPPLFLVFTLRWAGYTDVLTKPRLGVLGGEALLFMAVALTNGRHGLLWRDTRLLPAGATPAVELTFTPVYLLHAVYAYLLVMLGIAVLVSVYLNSSSIHNRQAGLMLLGAGPPFVVNAAYTMNVSPVPHLDLTPFVFVITGATYGYALFHFDLLEQTPMAQQRAIELVGDGLLVVDSAGHVEDANAVARRILDFDMAKRRSFANLVPVDDVPDLHGTIRTVSGPDGRHAYDTLVSELANSRGQFTGYAVVFRDVTDRYEYEQRLEVANRVLRHNLRNDMNVILGHAQIIREEADDDRISAYARNIETKAEDLVALSEKARELSTLRHIRADDEQSVTVATLVRDMVAEFERSHPEVSFEVSCSEDAIVDVVTRGGFEVAVRNLLENAVEHNDAAEPRVEVTVETSAGETHVTVRDNGPGLPEPEQALLSEGTQTPIQHSEGLGLWLTNWVVTAAGGSVSFEATPKDGTSITLNFLAGTVGTFE